MGLYLTIFEIQFHTQLRVLSCLALVHALQTILTELSYSEHWPAVLGAVGGLVDASDPRVWRKVRVVVDSIRLLISIPVHPPDHTSNPRKALHLCWELFACLTPAQSAEAYLAVAAGTARVLRGAAGVRLFDCVLLLCRGVFPCTDLYHPTAWVVRFPQAASLPTVGGADSPPQEEYASAAAGGEDGGPVACLWALARVLLRMQRRMGEVGGV